MKKYIYHDAAWSSNQDTSNVFFTGFVGNGNTQTIQESNQYFNWTHDNRDLMRLTADGNLNVIGNIAFDGILPPTNISGTFLNVRQLYSGTSNYIPTNGTKQAMAYIVGAGGGGGGTLSNTFSAGGGGAAGGLCISHLSQLSNTSYSCQIGTGGAGSYSNGNDGEYLKIAV
jgi:hypothetical protein